jgi:hypothetical protein
MTLFKPRATQPLRFGLRRPGRSPAAAKRVRRPVLAALVVFAMTTFTLPASQTFAADPPWGARSVPGTVVPSTGTTALGGAGQRDGRCAVLQKRYAESEACFARYRMKNHGLRPGAFQHCKQLKDPSAGCGPAVAP